MKKGKIVVALMLIICLTFPQSSLAKDTKKVGNVHSISGVVDIKKGGGNKLFKAFKNMAFTQGDTVITGDNGRAELSLDKDKEVIVAANTKLVISELISSVKAKSGKTNLTLVGGKVKVKVNKKLEGESRFNIQTPNAIMGVMGTEFYVYYDEHGTWVGVLEGEVTVDIGGDDPIKVGANQSLLLDDEGNHKVIELDAAQVLRFKLESSDESQEKPRRPIIVYDSVVSTPEDIVDDVPDEGTGGGPPPPLPSNPNPTLLSAEDYDPNPGLQNQLKIEYASYGNTLTKIFLIDDQNNMTEVEEIYFERVNNGVLLKQEFLQNKLETDRSSIEMKLEFSSGFMLPVTLKRMVLVEVDEVGVQAELLSEYQSDKRIIIPFTQSIESNVGDVQPPSTLKARVLLKDESETTYDISNITIQGNRLILTLDNLLPVLSNGMGYRVVIEEFTLRNQENGIVQREPIMIPLSGLN